MRLLREIIMEGTENDSFPFTIKSFEGFKGMKFGSEITFFVGENGSGKSTLLEAIALGCNIPTVGSSDFSVDEDLGINKKFSDRLKFVWSLNSRKGFFMRAEDFFGFIKRIKQIRKTLGKDRRRFDQSLSGYGRDLAVGSVEGQLRALESRYGDLSRLSHGEGFLKLFQQRLVPNGLYLLDEPEAALSPVRQLSLISLMKEMSSKNCQFIVATHSPILMSYPGADIYSFDGKIKKINYSDVDHVVLTKRFLDNPEIFLSKL